jgi:electron transfer flavoprotein alpha subunit
VILVIAEQRAGRLHHVSWEAVAAGQQLAGDEPVVVAVLGDAVQPLAAELATADVSEVLAIEHALLAAYTPDATVLAVGQVLDARPYSAVVLPHTYQTRDFAPMLAGLRECPLITDVTAIRGSGTEATFVRQMFQGRLSAEVVGAGSGPVCVTVQVGAFRADAARRGSGAPIVAVPVEIAADRIRHQVEAPFQEAAQAVELGQAERIVAIGRGIKAQEHVALAARLATAMRAELAASRPICDSGWLPMDRQVGSSGQTVAPKLYVALGISGAIQHLVGMKGSRTIVAVNKDPDAPIFEIADYGIVGDLFEVVPALIAALEK